jgi:ATP-binding cassette subfamily C protein
MAPALLGRWLRINDRYLAASERAADVVSTYGSSTKVLRLLLQSGILGLGAYLVIQQDLTAGAMIAASIMMGRALAPVETAIGNWRAFISARQSIRRLSQSLARVAPAGEVTVLHKPQHDLVVEGLIVTAPGTDVPIVTGVHFSAKAGEAIGIIGPSGAGKTSLMRTLIGAWPPAKGSIRLDGATLDQWSPEELGKSIGYVPQDVELFDGTVAENIGRMSSEPKSDWILAAAKSAGAHDMIVRLPNGYDTRIGEAGRILSGGQRQRIALARAFYGAPFLLALDEPSSNLDHEGEAAFHASIRHAKAQGAVVIVIAHRPSALSECDKVVFLTQGSQQAFGPRDEVLRKVLARSGQTAPAANLHVVDMASGASRD